MVTTPDGRTLEVLDAGPAGSPVVVFHNGTPGGPVLAEHAVRAAHAAGLRWVTYARPGYGGSTPQPGRSVADASTDTASVLDALGVDDFVTYGWSGGGPHALACAARLPGRCRAAATIAGVAPYGAEGLDFLAGMGQENIDEFGLALQGREALEPTTRANAEQMRIVTADGIIDAFASWIPAVDRASLTDDFAEWLAASMRAAVADGHYGWLDDDLAFTVPWGFAFNDITVPVAVWQGEQDLMVPFGHGVWLAEHLPTAQARLFPEHGHLSLGVAHLPEILAELALSARC